MSDTRMSTHVRPASGSSGRVPRARIPLLVLAVVLAVLVAVLVQLVDDEGDGQARSSPSMPTPLLLSDPSAAPSAPSTPDAASLQFGVDIRQSLAPLLRYAGILPDVITRARRGFVSAGELRSLAVMAEQFAVARDQVGSVAAPPGLAGLRQLVQIACQLYRESALTLESLLRGGATGASATARAALVLRDLADRMIDQYRRLLGTYNFEDPGVTFHYPAPVPRLDEFPFVLPLSAQPEGEAAALNEGRELLDELTTLPAADAALLERFPQLGAVATVLQRQASDAEPTISARMAVLVALLAGDAKFYGRLKTADDLLLISNTLWSWAASLPEAGRELTSLSPAATTPFTAWDGGAGSVLNAPTPPVFPAPGPPDQNGSGMTP